MSSRFPVTNCRRLEIPPGGDRRKGMPEPEQSGKSERVQKNRFQAFDVPPGTPVIPASRVQKALDEGGIV